MIKSGLNIEKKIVELLGSEWIETSGEGGDQRFLICA